MTARALPVADKNQPVEVEAGLDLEPDIVPAGRILACAVLGLSHRRHCAPAGHEVAAAAAVAASTRAKSLVPPMPAALWREAKTGLITANLGCDRRSGHASPSPIVAPLRTFLSPHSEWPVRPPPPPPRGARHSRRCSRASAMPRCSGLLALVVAVAVATAYLPSYSDLTKRSDLGQMIRVHAANGQVLVSIGPSFGKWLPYDQIPPEMRAAMISTEDRRFRSHIGIDPIGIGRAIASAVRREPPRQRDLDDHPAARPQHLPDEQPQLRPQDQGSDPRARARAEIHQGPDPRALSEPRLFRRRRLRHRRRVAEVLRPWRRSAEPGRSGDHRRAGQGAVQLFANRRHRGGAIPLGRGAPDDGEERLHQPGGRGRGRTRPTSESSRPRTTTACAISPTGRCPSSIS